MAKNRNQEFFGIFLAVIGLLFLLVNNNLLWFGWEVLWPIVPFLVGLFLIRVYFARRKPRQLFAGSLLMQFGVFFFLFSAGVFGWEQMDIMWPTMPLMIGISLLLLAVVVDPASSPMVFGIFMVAFAIFGYLTTTGAIASRVSGPAMRLWPLVLVGAGVLIYLRSKGEREAASATAPAPASDTPAKPKSDPDTADSVE